MRPLGPLSQSSVQRLGQERTVIRHYGVAELAYALLPKLVSAALLGYSYYITCFSRCGN